MKRTASRASSAGDAYRPVEADVLAELEGTRLKPRNEAAAAPRNCECREPGAYEMDLSVVIVTYSSERDIAACLESVYAHAPSFRFEVIVVDNASPDDTARIVRERFPQVRLIEADGNVGFARGNNLGLRARKGEFALLLNPDTLVEGNALEEMVRFMRTEERVGVVGCRLVDGNGNPERSYRRFPSVAYATFVLYPFNALYPRGRAFRGFLACSPRSCPVTRLLRKKKKSPAALARIGDARSGDPAGVDWVTGACMMLRGEMLRQIGGLDEGYFMYFEDTDLCWRARRADWLVAFLPSARVVHLKGRSAEYRADDFAIVQSLRSFFRFVAVNRGPAALLASRLIAVAAWLAHLCVSLVGARRRGAFRRHMRLLRVILVGNGKG